MSITSLLQLRIIRFLASYLMWFVVWTGSDYFLDNEFHLGFNAIWALVMAGMFSLIDNSAAGTNLSVYIPKESVDEFVRDLRDLGFTRLVSGGSKQYYFSGGSLVSIEEHPQNARLEVPRKLELIAKAYRK